MRTPTTLGACLAAFLATGAAYGQSVALPAAAPPGDEPGPTAVVVVASGGSDVTDEVLSQARAAAGAAVEARRDYHGREVRAERDPSLALRASACPDDACMVDVGRDAGAGYLMVLMIERTDTGHRATVLLIDVAGAAMAGSAAFDLPADPGAFAGAAQGPLAPLVAAVASLYPQVGTIAVAVDLPGAEVFLDGRRVGAAPVEPLTDIEPGPRALRVVAEGYLDFEQAVEVVAGEEARVTVTMTPAPAAAPVPPPATPLWRRWWFWTAVGAVVVGTGLGVGLGVGLAGDGDTRTVRYGVEFPTYEPR
jgi:hypothetical protein